MTVNDANLKSNNSSTPATSEPHAIEQIVYTDKMVVKPNITTNKNAEFCISLMENEWLADYCIEKYFNNTNSILTGNETFLVKPA